MMGWHFQKWLKSYRWALLCLLGILSLVIVILISHGDRLFLFMGLTPTTSPSPVVSASPTPITTPSAPPSPSPSSKQAATGKANSDTPPALALSPEPEPSLTAEQQAAQQAAIAELEASIPTVDSLVEMKVAIEVSVPSVRVGVSAEADLLNDAGEVIDTLSSGSSYTVQVSGESVVFDSSPLTQIVWIEPSPDGVFYLNDRAYRGRLLLAAANGSLWAVNYVSMRSYLYSVVPSEVSPSWSMEAIKAQAIAARSYALTYYFEPVNSLYDLGDDEYFQVYSGLEREAERTNQAVNETAGEYVSYKGGVVESLYAASDDIVAEAFQGQGMSQLGALSLAEQGYSYEQILANYYPGTKVGRIAQDF